MFTVGQVCQMDVVFIALLWALSLLLICLNGSPVKQPVREDSVWKRVSPSVASAFYNVRYPVRINVHHMETVFINNAFSTSQDCKFQKGVRVRLKTQQHLPSIFMANVQFLRSKICDLQAIRMLVSSR